MMKKQNSKYYIFSIFSFILFHIPIITIYLNSVVNSITLVSILFTVKSITTAIFEIPTGYISDRYSRKLSLLIGIFFNILSLFLFVYNPSFYSLLIAEICFGLSECLISGSDSAFYYDNFNAEGRKEDYNLFIKNIGLIQSVFLSISFLVGSIMYGFNNKIVFVFTIIFQVMSLLTLLLIKEHPYKKDIKKKIKIKDEIKIFIQNADKTTCYILIIYSFILGMFLSIYLQLFPMITANITDNYYLYGGIYVIVMMTFGIGSKNSNEDIMILPKLLFILLISMSVGIVVSNDLYILIVVIITRFIWGYIGTGLNIYVNNNVSNSNYRATIFSILSILTSIFSSVFMFLTGIIMDKHIKLNYLFIIWSLIILSLFILSRRVVFLKGGEINELQ